MSRVSRVRIRVRGRVQGVGFRSFVYREAIQRGVGGWVRNLADGSVESEAEGPREALEGWLAAIGTGPRGARIDELSVQWSEGAPRARGFEIA